MFPQESFTIASSYIIYRSNQLEGTQEVRDSLLSIGNEESSLIGVESDETANETLRVSRMSTSELREVEVFFHLLVRDLPSSSELTEDVQPMEKAVLASLFLDRD